MTYFAMEEMKKYNLINSAIDPQKTVEEVFLSNLSRKVIEDLGHTPPADNYRDERLLGEVKKYSNYNK